MQILAVASEIHPLIKTGGLADVVGALPAALAKHGVTVTTLVPGYPALLGKVGSTKVVGRYQSLFGAPALLLRAQFATLDLLILDAPALFDRDGGAYGDAAGRDWSDNWRRFAALSAVGADVARGSVKGLRPDLVHAHDWQAALTLAYLRHGGGPPVPGILTVHNLGFQGRFDAAIFAELGLPASAFAVDGVEYYDGVGYLKAGLHYADAITTVSPTYADEIRTPAFGMGLDGLLNARADVLHGIVNGIDTAEWNPASDPHIPAHYTARAPAARRLNRRAVEAAFGLAADDTPLFCVVSRLTWQKGMDLLAAELDTLVAMGARLALLGSGDAAIEAAMLAVAARHPGRIGVRIGFDERLSHLLQAGADAILVPSRTEPCGLTQLYGLRYGCVPVVARTGGLADTVIHANDAAIGARVATGIQFGPVDAPSLHQALARTIALHAQPDVWASLVRQGMKADFSWDHSAARYAALYRSLIEPGTTAA